MKSEWVERLHDQARTEMGYCVPASEGQWCIQHDSRKPIGQDCAAMCTAYDIAESAGEVVGDLIADAIEALPTYLNAGGWVDRGDAARVARGGAS